jgi:hypothetical protein
MILDRISVKRHNTVRSNDPNSNTLTELLTLSRISLVQAVGDGIFKILKLGIIF